MAVDLFFTVYSPYNQIPEVEHLMNKKVYFYYILEAERQNHGIPSVGLCWGPHGGGCHSVGTYTEKITRKPGNYKRFCGNLDFFFGNISILGKMSMYELHWTSLTVKVQLSL